jgi:hypothetical protein
MRSILVSVVFVTSTVVAAFSAASCSSSSSPVSGGDDGGAGGSSSGSSSGGSTSGSSSGSTACVAYESDADLTTPTVSFSKDVLPLFEHSCGLSSSCHFDPGPNTISTLGIFLGCDINYDAGAGSVNACVTATPGPIVYQDLVGTADGGPLAPLEITGMPFVTAGDPTKSYIMHKLDGDLCTLTTCKMGNVAVNDQMDTPGSVSTNPELPPNWCGQSMPLNNDLLPAGPACGGSQDCTQTMTYARDTVRLWIAQGAMNN